MTSHLAPETIQFRSDIRRNLIMIAIGVILIVSTLWPPFKYMGWPLFLGMAVLLAGLFYVSGLLGGLKLTPDVIAWRPRGKWHEVRWEDISEIRIAPPRPGLLRMSPGIEIITAGKKGQSFLLPEYHGHHKEALLAIIEAYRSDVFASRELK